MSRRDREDPEHAIFGIHQMHKALEELRRARRYISDERLVPAMTAIELASENLRTMIGNFQEAGILTQKEADTCPNPWPNISIKED